MPIEIKYLAWVTVLTLLMRIPWMIDKLAVRGLDKITQYPDDSEPLSAWGRRAWIAHEDALGNLVTFAILVVLLHLVDWSNGWTQGAAAVYFYTRVLHFVVYVLGVPRIKSIAFLVAFAAQLVLAWQLLIASQ